MLLKNPIFRLKSLTAAVLAVTACATLVAVRPAAGDDRALLRSSTGLPYVFIILDTSGSMNWAPPCSATQFAAGQCAPLCPQGDCYVPLQADDPGSKLYQAKEALTTVLAGINDVRFGFATYNQDAFSARGKHWLYKATSAGPTITGYGAYPAVGSQEAFGLLWTCINSGGSGDNAAGCGSTTPADLSNAWQFARMQRLPKGGATFTSSQTFYVKTGGNTYKIIYAPVAGGVLGNPTIQTLITTAKCNNSSCSNTTAVGSQTVTWSYIHDFISWDNAPGGGTAPQEVNPELTYFTSTASDSSAANTCSGWDPNTDTVADQSSGYSIRQPTDSSDLRGTLFTVGDVIPLDWLNDHNLDVRKRLAPNLELTPAATPDFSIATYFNNTPWSAETFLRIPTGNAKDTVTARSLHAPLMGQGSTPIGASLQSFRQWFAGCATGVCTPGLGWRGIAASLDPNYACSRKYVLFITDGDETCSGSPCTVAQSLHDIDGVTTYILGFGLSSATGNTLTCVAQNGGSGAPIYPQNKQELIDAITAIFSQIREQATAFASAAVPSVQAEVADKLFLTSFVPLNDESIWNGHVNAFLKPLPLTSDGKPDTTRSCSSLGSNPSSCLLWDAAQVLYNQAPSATDLTGGNYKLGSSTSQRRVFYTYANTTGNVPSQVRLFQPPSGNPPSSDWADLWQGLKITVDPLNLPAAQTRATQILQNTLVQKSSIINNLNGTTTPVNYVLGDIFHSDPVLFSNPDNFVYYASDLYGNSHACTDKPSDNPGYRCYAERHRKRRKMILLGANDGQLHALDTGTWDAVNNKFSNGTGEEIFSYVPRLVLPILRDQSANGATTQIYSIDGTARLDDVFIDPKYTGAAGPTAADREWRSLLIGGFREGGSINGGGQVSGFVSGYYALDVTDPDPLDTANVPTTTGPVAGCLSSGSLNTAATGCGTNPFPAVLWEFTDSFNGSRFDEDGNAAADLGWTWSVPTIGRIQVTESGTVVQKSVAIFGGGFDPLNKTTPKSGTWVYIVDIETGQAIYKHQVQGAVPADVAVLDANQDGLLDTIYLGTTSGFVYKMDISKAATLAAVTIDKSKFLPALASNASVKRVTDTAWDPFKIFDTGGRPIYFAPTAFFVAPLNLFALTFGTGDRENLWNFSGQVGRYYLIVDESFTSSTSGLPKTESNYKSLTAASADVTSTSDFVISPTAGNNRGWVMQLDADERVITQAFGLSGIVIFSTYKPQIVISGSGSTLACASTGTSRIFVVYTSNANSVMKVEGLSTRFTTVPEFVTNPFVEQGATKNSPASNKNSEQLDTTQAGILDTLKSFYPKNTKFANYWISVSGVRSDTGYIRYATIPIGIVVKNWKEY